MILKRLRGAKRARKVFVIGLDCAAPELIFTRWKDDLPNLAFLAENGIWGELESCIPAITVPAWASMLSGRDPGELGIYGFRNRSDHSYTGRFVATADHVRERRIWDYLSEVGMESVLIGVPQTYPVRPINGAVVAGFLAPSVQSAFTYPRELREEVLTIAPNYDVDVADFRTDDKDALLGRIWEMTEERCRVVETLLTSSDWDFFMMVEIGVDRIQHGFWSYHDPAHRRYRPGNRFESAIHDYYVYLDGKIGSWLELIEEDTVVIVVSDHGAKSMEGGICLNEWLWRQGYLVFKEDPVPGKVTPFDHSQVDWPKTLAWGDGGYYGRVFLNVAGREPEGVLEGVRYEEVRSRLAEELVAIRDPDGKDLNTRVFKPEEIYRSVNGVAPDLMVYFGDLSWRSIGSLGHGSIHTFENDTGPDECNHARNGMFVIYDPTLGHGGHAVDGAQITDVASTLFELFDLDVPMELRGHSLLSLQCS